MFYKIKKRREFFVSSIGSLKGSHTLKMINHFQGTHEPKGSTPYLVVIKKRIVF